MTTGLMITMSTTPIPVTVDIFERPREHEGPTVVTVTKMEALRRQKRRHLRGWRPPRRPIPVSISTFEAYLERGGGGYHWGGAGNAERRTIYGLDG